jgi:hypothetical protein
MYMIVKFHFRKIRMEALSFCAVEGLPFFEKVNANLQKV